MQDIDSTMLEGAYEEWKRAPKKRKTYMVQRWADILGISFQTLHRKFKDRGYNTPHKKEKCTKGTPVIPRLHEYARTVAHMYAFLPRGARKPAIPLVIEKGLLNGLLPEEAASVHPSTIARVIREQKLLDEDGRVLRFQAARPMEQVQYDVSGSEYLYVHRMEKGEPVLRVRAIKTYKNKDRFENFRLWYHGMVDDCSRYWLAMPFVSPGESSIDAIAFSRWAFSVKEDSRIIFRGLPSRVYMDNGPLARAQASMEFFSRIGVEIKTHEPGSPEDTGKIEIKWKQLWASFESLEFLMDPNWETREYTLADIRQRLVNYMVRLNRQKHPLMHGTKEEIWQTVIHQGGVVDIDEGAFNTVFRRHKRYVQPDGTFSLDSTRYFTKGLYDSWVYVYEGLTGNQMMAEDILSHKRYPVEEYHVPGLDEIKKDKKLPGTGIREEAKEYKKRYLMEPFKGLYEGAPADDEKVATFPIRSKEERRVENPFDVTAYPSIEEARAEFYDTVGTLIPEEEWRDIATLIADNGFKKQYVTDLALEVRGEMERQQHTNL